MGLFNKIDQKKPKTTRIGDTKWQKTLEKCERNAKRKHQLEIVNLPREAIPGPTEVTKTIKRSTEDKENDFTVLYDPRQCVSTTAL